MIESCSQTGHRRRMTLSDSTAHSSSILRGWTESGIKIIVAQGALPGVDLPRSEPEAELPPPEKKIQLKENNASHLQLLGV
jgi:hypothetical protein